MQDPRLMQLLLLYEPGVWDWWLLELFPPFSGFPVLFDDHHKTRINAVGTGELHSQSHASEVQMTCFFAFQYSDYIDDILNRIGMCCSFSVSCFGVGAR